MHELHKHQVQQILLNIAELHPDVEPEINLLREILLPCGEMDAKCAECQYGGERRGICQQCVDYDKFKGINEKGG